MKLVIDDKIPFVKGLFEPFADVAYLPGQAIRKEDLFDADALITRTRTHCDERLLEGTPVRFIASATIGFDHIDTAYCSRMGIRWTNAPGCNSASVAQYIASTLMELSLSQGFTIQNKTLGIIGVGHVGSRVERIAKILGIPLLLNDPPRERTEGTSAFTSLDTVLRESDIITLHVPLNREGPDKTLGLVDRSFLEKIKPGAILINTSRGEIIQEEELLRHLNQKKPTLVLDVWDKEPNISPELLSAATLATPHIAGYSLDGKYNATRMAVEAVADFFGFKPDLPNPPTDGLPRIIDLNRSENPITQAILASYPIREDDRRLRESPGEFELLRNQYPIRREYPAWTVIGPGTAIWMDQLAQLGFRTLLT